MLGIICAMHCEAAPLISHYELKKNMDIPWFECYQRDDLILIISKVGRIRAAAATSFFFTQFKDPRGLVNTGVAGSLSNHPLGGVFLINKIINKADNRIFLPDILFPNALPEASLLTSEVFVSTVQPEFPGAELVDMEASAIFEAASLFAGPERVMFLKIVSDYLVLSDCLNKEKISSLIDASIPEIDRAISLLSGHLRDKESPFSDQEISLINLLS